MNNKIKSKQYKILKAIRNLFILLIMFLLHYGYKYRSDFVFYLEPHASSGDSNAQLKLGALYYNGYGLDKDFSKVKRDTKKGLYWIEKSASLGNVRAQSILGKIYLKGGVGVSKNYNQAMYWLIKASDNNSLDAKADLSYMYILGLGVQADEIQGIDLLKNAAHQGHERSKKALNILCNDDHVDYACEGGKQKTKPSIYVLRGDE